MLPAHIKHNLPATHDLIMRNIIPVQHLTIQHYLLHIHILRALVFHKYRKCMPVFQVQHSLAHSGAAQRIVHRAGRYRVKAHGTQDIPRAHLPAIVIAAKACRCGLVHFIQRLPYTQLRFPGLVGPVIQVGYVVRWLVAMHVVAYDAVPGYILRLCIKAIGLLHLK